MKPELELGRPQPIVASVTMGYGHLRAAYPLAEQLGVDVLEVDRPPLARPEEVALWAWVRRTHELLSRPMPLLGPFDRPARSLMDALTLIPPLHEGRDHRAPTWSVRLLELLIGRGLGRGMVQRLRSSGAPLVTTFYAPAIIADRAGVSDIYCVVTDADCNRVWAPLDAARTRIRYCAPTPRVVRRLKSFGVPEQNIFLTGFPLPPALTRGSEVTSPEARLMERFVRLDPRGVFRKLHGKELSLLFPHAAASRRLAVEGALSQRGGEQPVHLMFAVGGAGAQAEMAEEFLPSLAPMITSGRVRLQLAFGTRADVRRSFEDAVARAGLGAELERGVVLVGGDDFEAYYTAFNLALLRTDVLWTKPSELSFYPALGIPCVMSRPVGAHERYNRRWLREQGAGLKQRRRDHTSGWLSEWLEDGTLATAAWSGFLRLPKHGTVTIAELVQGQVRSETTTDSLAPRFVAPRP